MSILGTPATALDSLTGPRTHTGAHRFAADLDIGALPTPPPPAESFVNASSNLVAAYNGSLQDISGNGYNLTSSGTAFTFDAATSTITFPNDANAVLSAVVTAMFTTMTCSLQVFLPTSVAGQASAIVCTAVGATVRSGRLVYGGGAADGLSIYSNESGTARSIYSPSLTPVGQWHHVVVHQTNTENRLYINGAQATPMSTQAGTFITNLVNPTVFIGKWSGSGFSVHGGVVVKRVRLFANLAMTDEIARTLYAEDLALDIPQLPSAVPYDSGRLNGVTRFVQPPLPGTVFRFSGGADSPLAITSGDVAQAEDYFVANGSGCELELDTEHLFINDMGRFTVAFDVLIPAPRLRGTDYDVHLASVSVYSFRRNSLAGRGRLTVSTSGGWAVTVPYDLPVNRWVRIVASFAPASATIHVGNSDFIASETATYSSGATPAYNSGGAYLFRTTITPRGPHTGTRIKNFALSQWDYDAATVESVIDAMDAEPALSSKVINADHIAASVDVSASRLSLPNAANLFLGASSLQTSLGAKANIASPTFTGTVALPAAANITLAGTTLASVLDTKADALPAAITIASAVPADTWQLHFNNPGNVAYQTQATMVFANVAYALAGVTQASANSVVLRVSNGGALVQTPNPSLPTLGFHLTLTANRQIMMSSTITIAQATDALQFTGSSNASLDNDSGPWQLSADDGVPIKLVATGSGSVWTKSGGLLASVHNQAQFIATGNAPVYSGSCNPQFGGVFVTRGAHVTIEIIFRTVSTTAADKQTIYSIGDFEIYRLNNANLVINNAGVITTLANLVNVQNTNYSLKVVRDSRSNIGAGYSVFLGGTLRHQAAVSTVGYSSNTFVVWDSWSYTGSARQNIQYSWIRLASDVGVVTVL